MHLKGKMLLTSKMWSSCCQSLVVVLMIHIHLASQDYVQQPSNLEIMRAITNLQSHLDTQITSQLERKMSAIIEHLETKIEEKTALIQHNLETKIMGFCGETFHNKTALLENSFNEITINSSQEIMNAVQQSHSESIKSIKESIKTSNGGCQCTGEKTREENCTTPIAKVDGEWSNWGPWTTCTLPCGGGVKHRTRVCDAPAPSSGGDPCQGQEKLEENCNSAACPVHGCPEADGFFLSADGNQCFKVILDQLGWEAAKEKCASLNLVLAHPQDPFELRKYLNSKYEDGKYFHVHARGTGSVWQWRDGTLLDSSSSMWWSGWSSSSKPSSNQCLLLSTSNSSMTSYPDIPYDSSTCASSRPVLCEVIKF
ncbi:unnamed protein product, partial [Meganyctiphanes norvegica]